MLIFKGLRFPAARTTGRHHLVIPNPDGTLLKARGFVTIATSGRGRAWTPEPVDATWRTFAGLDLGGSVDGEDFVQRRGDPFGQRGKQINTVQWFHLAFALRHATQDWLDPDKDGVSHPRAGTSRWHDGKKFLDHQAALSALTQTTLVPAPKGEQVLAIKATTLAAFMVLRAAQALEERRPMQRCLRCGFWFEIRREQRGPRFCSNSCRALHHQRPETAHGLDA